ncbi:MAG: hypothetical protein AB7F88_03355 [Pyrinomonadaceae bacterium]
MEADETTQNAIKELINAIQMSVDSSPIVKGAIANLQHLGYIPNFTVRMDLELLRPMDDALTSPKVRMA